LDQNTFPVNVNPEIFFRLNDWILFLGSLDASWNPGSSGASFSSGVADAQIFLNDYMEVVLGAFDQPFDDFYEDLGAFWVNRFITAPLPYGVRAMVPPSDIGMQFRGAYQWGQLGQDADYTVWVANGPSYDTSLPQPVIGQAINGFNNIGSNTNGRAYGARFRVYPFPLDSNLGRLELGASTYNGKWMNSLWLNSWGGDSPICAAICKHAVHFSQPIDRCRPDPAPTIGRDGICRPATFSMDCAFPVSANSTNI